MLERAQVPVVVRRLDRAATEWDPDFKVPSGSLRYGLPEKVKALVRWDTVQHMPAETGMMVVRSGSFAVPVEARTPLFKPGDMVTEIGGIPLNPPVYITGVRPSALVGGRYRFVRYTFESRPEGVRQ